MHYFKLIYLTIFLCLKVLGSFAQSPDWTESLAIKAGKIILPADLTISFPTTDNYTIGYFIYNADSTVFLNVGQVDYVPGTETTIQLGYDPAGITGYKDGARFMTLVRNNSTSETYGIEFGYLDDKNHFLQNDSSVVTNVITDTWRDFFNSRFYFCRSEPPIAIHIPYGLKTYALYTPGIAVDSSAGYPVILFSEMTELLGTFQLFSNGIKYVHTLYGFGLIDFPANSLNQTYFICPGEVVTIPSFKDSLKRTPVSNGTYNLIGEGTYVFDLLYQPYGCPIKDTITVLSSPGSCPKVNYEEVINPETGLGVVFPDSEKIIVLNAALEQVVQLNSPLIWNGTDSNGRLLPVGVYYVVHENGYTHSVSIIY